MKSTPIRVESYSGYKADEYPVSFNWNNRAYQVREILDRWHQADRTVDWLEVNYFKVITTTNMLCILKHDIEIDQWFLVQVF